MSKKRIALMTWHHVENYGTAYQAYALKEAIRECGCDVDVIDYNRTENPVLQRRSLSDYVLKLNLRELFFRGKAEYTFSEECFRSFFDSRFTYTHKCVFRKDFEQLNAEYDGFVCGSDQIWGPDWFDPHYFLDFVPDQSRKIAYAPSIGTSNLSQHPVVGQMGQLIRQFGCLSVREKSSCQEISQLIGGRKVFNAIDPVLLVDRNKWLEMAQPPKNMGGSYGFIFFLRNNEQYFRTAIAHAGERNLQTKIYHCTQSEDNRFVNMEELSPEALLGVIRNADFVYTDSFHIMVLSIIFGVPFRIFDKYQDEKMQAQNRRLHDLMERLGIPEWSADDTAVVDYSQVHQRLDVLRANSMRYLSEALDAVPEGMALEKENVCDKYATCSVCPGKLPDVVIKYLQNSGKEHSKLWTHHMRPWNFLLQNPCYECDKLIDGYNIRKPVFFEELCTKCMHNEKLQSLYGEFYAAYDLPVGIKALLKNRRK